MIFNVCIIHQVYKGSIRYYSYANISKQTCSRAVTEGEKDILNKNNTTQIGK